MASQMKGERYKHAEVLEVSILIGSIDGIAELSKWALGKQS
jgi:hypothetical protein